MHCDVCDSLHPKSVDYDVKQFRDTFAYDNVIDRDTDTNSSDSDWQKTRSGYAGDKQVFRLNDGISQDMVLPSHEALVLQFCKEDGKRQKEQQQWLQNPFPLTLDGLYNDECSSMMNLGLKGGYATRT